MDTIIELESLINNLSDSNSGTNENFLIFEEWFQEAKAMLMFELKDSINKIKEVNIYFNED